MSIKIHAFGDLYQLVAVHAGAEKAEGPVADRPEQLRLSAHGYQLCRPARDGHILDDGVIGVGHGVVGLTIAASQPRPLDIDALAGIVRSGVELQKGAVAVLIVKFFCVLSSKYIKRVLSFRM